MANNDMDRVVPLGQLDDYKVAEGDPDVRGWEVMASDGRKIGEVDELLVDTNAMKVRYLDVDVEDGVIGDGMDRHVLIPIGYARLEQERDRVMVDGLASADLHALPAYDQGPLTRDFESSVRDSFSHRGTASTTTVAGTTGAGMTGAGARMVDTAGLDNSPGTGTGLGLSGTAAGADLSDAGTRTREHHLGDGVPAGEGMRAAGYDAGSANPMQPGTGSPRTGLDSDPGTSTGGMSAGAGSQGPVAGMGTDRGPQGDMSHRASTGSAGSDYQHNADEDFYASDAFDDSRFYGARRGGTAGGGLGGTTPSSGTGGGMNASSGGLGASSGGASLRGGGDPGGMSDSMGADRDETARLAREASERLREDQQNRGVGGSGSL